MTEAEQIQILRDVVVKAIAALGEHRYRVGSTIILEELADVLLRTSPVNTHLKEPPLGEGPGGVTAQPPPWRLNEHGEPELW